MSVAIILAGGRGTRMSSKHVNKVVLPFLGKPLIQYGVELFSGIVRHTFIVVGAYAESVKKALHDYPNLLYAYQKDQLGTADAVKIALQEIEKIQVVPQAVLVGYGDHMMFYKKKTIRELIHTHMTEKAAITLVTTPHDNPDELAWGRIIRGKLNNHVIDIVEQKDATPEVLKIQELNAGLYCFNYMFLKRNINSIQKSPVTHEYYLTDLIKLAAQQKQKVVGLRIPFSEVGIGINKDEELTESQEIYKTTHDTKQL